MTETYKPMNMETDPRYNTEGGVVVVPGSNYAKEMEKFEQFPSKFGSRPGNPYAYRPFPKMLYRAEHWNGKATCMAAEPNPVEYSDPREWERHQELARRFTEKCQRIVNDEREMQAAMENGWREGPLEAVEYLLGRDKDVSTATAHRHFEDRNMSEKAKAEIKAAEEEAGGAHIPEIPAKPIRRRGRPKGSKNRKPKVA